MGTIAARDCIRVLELTEQVAAAHVLACVQAVELRADLERGEGGPGTRSRRHRVNAELEAFVRDVRASVSAVVEDRPLDRDLRTICQEIRSRKWPLYG